ncbi:bleomycin resistance protein [Pseudogemmobacter bohemicus]|uniref:bleomycin resistance protein n=1 Tax=Pseudogemmobacter bohemicus TaxID=2250708 RepID=UPI000DD4A6D0|nr:bleomycin resistance protein [Pseudogemmobacter bohemicus]
MGDRITANLPARDMRATADFYGRLGFETRYFSEGWMIIGRGALELEFFGWPDLDPKSSNFSACIRLDDPDAVLAEWQKLGLPSGSEGIPRLTGFFRPDGAPRMFALIDPDGSLLRVIDNRD